MLTGGSNGDSVTQAEGQVTLSERDSSDCELFYETRQYPALFWYVRYPREAESLGEQVEQQPSTLSVQEGDSAIINCTYTGSAFSYFSWNKQEAGESPQLIIDILENVDRKQSQRLTVLLNKKTKQLSLHISATQPGDTAMYFCANQVSLSSVNMLPDTCPVLLLLLMLGKINGDSVTQTEGLVTVTEGSPVMLSCAYQTTYSAPTVFWYVQDLNKAPQLLLKSLTDNKRTEHQGFHATLHKSNSSFHLQKSSVQLSDSALYYCALSDTVTEMQGKLHTNQAYIPNKIFQVVLRQTSPPVPTAERCNLPGAAQPLRHHNRAPVPPSGQTQLLQLDGNCGTG
ncbi:Immunoglobulin V-set containing protein [Cricetulus griseus]|nr:Immunoglobulin V-set containing protein [Cricetulus griseus]